MLFTSVPITAFAASAPKAPSISVSTGDSAFTVSWKKVKGATGYKVYYTTDSKFKKGIKSISTKSTKKTVSKLSTCKKYYVRVKSYKTVKKRKKTKQLLSKYSHTVSLTTNVRPSRINSVSGGEATVAVKCTSASKVSGYQVQYATNSKFSGSKYWNSTSPTTTIKKLGGKGGAAQKYYVRVRTYKTYKHKNYYSNWSSSKSVSTKKVTYPNTPLVEDASAGLNFMTVKFLPYGNITGFRVQIATDNQFKKIVKTTSTVSNASVTISGLSENTVYYFRVCSVRNLNGVEYIGSWKVPKDNILKTESSVAKDAPSNIQLQLSNENKTCTASWSALSSSYDSVKYVLQYSTSQAFPNESYATKTINTTSTSCYFLTAYNFNYYVRVKAVVTKSGITYESPWSGTKIITALNPYAVEKAPDISNTNVDLNSFSVTWSAVSNATDYQVQYSKTSDFSNAILANTANLSYTALKLNENTTYYVRVRGFNSKGASNVYGPWSTTKAVKTKQFVVNEGVKITLCSDGEIVGDNPFAYGFADIQIFAEDSTRDKEYASHLRNVKKAYAETGITSSMSDVAKYLAITKWISCNLTYNKTDVNHTAAQALENGYTVCDGYAAVLADLCYFAGIPCYFVSSEKYNHAWNAIKLQGNWYYVDMTRSNGFFSIPATSQEPYKNYPLNTMALNPDSEKDLDPFHKKMYKDGGKLSPWGTIETRSNVGEMAKAEFSTVAKIKTPCRNSGRWASLDKQEIAYTPVTGGSNGNWLY